MSLTPNKWGNEFVVNSTTTDDQIGPAITALVNGRFVIAWSDLSLTTGDGESYEVRAQVFGADGNSSGAEFLVNTTAVSDQMEPALLALADGGFEVAWKDYSQSDGGTGGYVVRTQVFTADGSPSGAELVINNIHNNEAPTFAVLGDGRSVVAWQTLDPSSSDGSGYAVRAQIFNSDGTAAGSDFVVNTTTTGHQFQPAVTALTGSRFVVAWTDASQSVRDTSGYAVRCQVFNADGTSSGSEFLVNTSSTGDQSQPALAGLPDGRFVVAWTDSSQTGADTNFTAIRAQVFNADGSKSGKEFLVNSTTDSFQTDPSLTALADGRIVVAWQDHSQSGSDTSGYAVRAQIFDPRVSAVTLFGTPSQDEFVGTIWSDALNGGNGNDVLWGGAGNDTLQGGAGADRLAGGAGSDTYFVDTSGDLIIENALGGQDTVISSWLSLDLANYANVEHANVTGLQNLDLTGNNGANSLTGNAGNNLILGLGGNDTIYALSGSDKVFGGGGNDMLVGGAGNDTLLGGIGQDTLLGGVGKDRLVGGGGADLFIFQTKVEVGNGVNRDVISDFTHGIDRIDLSAIDGNELQVNKQALTFIDSAAFSHTAGELRYGPATGLLAGDVNGDGIADFQLQLIGAPVITAADLVL